MSSLIGVDLKRGAIEWREMREGFFALGVSKSCVAPFSASTLEVLGCTFSCISNSELAQETRKQSVIYLSTFFFCLAISGRRARFRHRLLLSLFYFHVLPVGMGSYGSAWVPGSIFIVR